MVDLCQELLGPGVALNFVLFAFFFWEVPDVLPPTETTPGEDRQLLNFFGSHRDTSTGTRRHRETWIFPTILVVRFGGFGGRDDHTLWIQVAPKKIL